jgi:histidinol dehydrogenase
VIDVLVTRAPDFEARFLRILDRAGSSSAEIRDRVAEILEAVRTRGDAALLELTAKLDDRPGVTAGELAVPPAQLQAALQNLPSEVKGALSRAAGRIRAFHGLQRAQIDDTILDDGRGLRAELRVQALTSVGIYVPGGTAAYPSTVLMNAIPAKVTGVPDVVMTTPARSGNVAPAVLAAACLADVDRVFTIGGAQAIAALAFGTETVPKVDKIVGPGNAYVAEAKRQVYGKVDIDQIAGPSEVLIIADDSADPRLVAADLLAQAEHDTGAAALAVVWSEPLAERIAEALSAQLADLPRSEIARAAIEARGGVILARDRVEAIELSNRYAPEHLGLALSDPREVLEEISFAGAVFLGHFTPEALGDYNAGVNHVLPTAGTARFGSPLSVHDFVRRMSVLSIDQRAISRIGPDAALLARAEGLEAHARAVEMRTKDGKEEKKR